MIRLRVILHAILVSSTLLFFAATSATPHAFAEETRRSLAEIYQLAIAQSEKIQQDQQSVKIAESMYRETFAGLFPNIHLFATERIRSSKSYGSSSSNANASSNDPNSPENGGRSSREPREFQSGISLRQPLFTGFRERYQTNAAKAEINAAEYDSQRNKELLYLDVAEIYHQIQLYEGDMRILEPVQDILAERLAQIERFIQLGRSRSSELLSIEAERAKVVSTIENTRGARDSSLELLAFLIGISAQSISLAEAAPLSPLEPLEYYLGREANRADILALTQRQSARQLERVVAERERWPYISLEGNYYPYEDPDLNRDWDLLLRFDIPIFEGGAISARVSRSEAELQKLNLALAEARRIAERDVRTSFTRCRASVAQVAALEKQVEAAKRNLDSQRRDYELGVVNNLDVLSAIRAVQDAARDLLSAQAAARIYRAELQVAIGDIS